MPVRIRAVKTTPKHGTIQPSLFALDKPDDAVAAVTPQEIVWLDARLTDLLREHNVALALTDTAFMPGRGKSEATSIW